MSNHGMETRGVFTRGAGGDDAYCVLQLMHSKIRLNFVGPSRYEYEYSTRVRSWISESKISDTRTNTGGGFGGSFTQPARSPPPFICSSYHGECGGDCEETNRLSQSDGM